MMKVNCPKCAGSGWVYADELYKHTGVEFDTTKYSCDVCSAGSSDEHALSTGTLSFEVVNGMLKLRHEEHGIVEHADFTVEFVERLSRTHKISTNISKDNTDLLELLDRIASQGIYTTVKRYDAFDL